MLQKYALSVVAAFIAEFVTFPLDLVKTRLQMQGEGVAAGRAQYRGMQGDQSEASIHVM